MLIRTTFVFVLLGLKFVSSEECPDQSAVAPCACVLAVPSHTYSIFNDYNPEVVFHHQRSIVCEDLHDETFHLDEYFLKLTEILPENQTDFDSFLLANTSVRHIPHNVFHNISFTVLMFENNFELSTIERTAFSSINEKVELFETLNTNLSDSETLFSILRQFSNLRRLSLQNDRLDRIPSMCLNQTTLRQIWLGTETRRTSQPIETIDDYAFSLVPNLRTLRIFSPKLSQIGKRSFAHRSRSVSNETLTILIGGERLHSESFAPTSLTRFRNRRVEFRILQGNITFLDENTFQPFLESNPLSIIEIGRSILAFRCDCRSSWLQLDYRTNVDRFENRVIGFPCWLTDFTSCQNSTNTQ